jgi:O-acetyl-ADP-ribose deacetylase (regulator of RNase III)
MSIKIITGNIFTSNCQTIVNTTNCVGVMGAGIALEYRLRYPEMYQRYLTLCESNAIDIGILWIYKINEKKWILNFPTKKDWKLPSKVEYLHRGLQKFLDTYKSKKIESVAFPILGSDKGKLSQEESINIMESYLKKADIAVEIYKYDPFAKDDLYEEIKDKMLSLTHYDYILKNTELKERQIKIVMDAMKSSDIVQLNQLSKIEGIGIKTMEQIFNLAKSLPDIYTKALSEEKPNQLSLI